MREPRLACNYGLLGVTECPLRVLQLVEVLPVCPEFQVRHHRHSIDAAATVQKPADINRTHGVADQVPGPHQLVPLPAMPPFLSH